MEKNRFARIGPRRELWKFLIGRIQRNCGARVIGQKMVCGGASILWYGGMVVWYGVVRCGIVWCGMVWYGEVRYE